MRLNYKLGSGESLHVDLEAVTTGEDRMGLGVAFSAQKPDGEEIKLNRPTSPPILKTLHLNAIKALEDEAGFSFAHGEQATSGMTFGDWISARLIHRVHTTDESIISAAETALKGIGFENSKAEQVVNPPSANARLRKILSRRLAPDEVKLVMRQIQHEIPELGGVLGR